MEAVGVVVALEAAAAEAVVAAVVDVFEDDPAGPQPLCAAEGLGAQLYGASILGVAVALALAVG